MCTTFAGSVLLTTIDCGECGGTYAINEDYRAEKHRTGGSWHCPYCEVGWGYGKNSENARLKRELETEKGRLAAEQSRHDQTKADLRDTEKRRQAEKGAKTRIKNRVAKGACPCCNRHFANLHRHMAGQHPDYATQE